MRNSTESELLGKIEVLEARVYELELQNDALRSKVDDSGLFARTKKNNSSLKYLINFIAAATFPLISGLFREIYRRIYDLKK
jgi:hypothetical protein